MPFRVTKEHVQQPYTRLRAISHNHKKGPDMRNQQRTQAFLLGSLLVTSCTGQMGDAPGAGETGTGHSGGPGSTGPGGPPSTTDPSIVLPPVPMPVACQTPAAGPSPLRRLTRVEYLNTLRDLLGPAVTADVAITPDATSLGFDNSASIQSVSQLLAEQYESTAITVAAAAVATLPAVLKCDVVAMGEDVCARKFIADFGLRAFRRPVTPAESTRMFTLYSARKVKQGFAGAIETLLQGMLMAPQLLYRVELANPATRAGVFEKLTSYEMATRLSYFLWATMPDQALFTAAAANQLDTPAQIAVQVGRMLGDARARTPVGHFYEQWLNLAGLDGIGKDPKLYPAFKPALPDLWKRETAAFVDDLIFKGDAKLKTLFLADYTFANKSLADFYQLKGPTSETQFDRVATDANHLGLLTQAGFLAQYANPDQSSPVRRGVFVREEVLGFDLPPPPNDMDIKAPMFTPGVSTRERFAMHSTLPVCAGCHRLIDPIGLAFENFDAIGKFRTMDQGKLVDVSAELTGTDVDGAFAGALELSRRLARSERVAASLVTKWFRFAQGRLETPQDACALETLKGQMKATGGDLKLLIVALTQTQVFLNKTGGAL